MAFTGADLHIIMSILIANFHIYSVKLILLNLFNQKSKVKYEKPRTRQNKYPITDSKHAKTHTHTTHMQMHTRVHKLTHFVILSKNHI